ncbi:DUF5518 domain-containing protein [Natronorubrum thiooxidans]|uniref:DUF5518 domain-containing protein n=1 Tax=Natronorubrum thiooxidans TaxID=308853 RepID=A0A1N7E2G5_9EURY|nr:DUF5518 domain-containing protein [Natronorubrum thiooxidans]SIR82155.1 hypothetical protein SAMN05421752_103141 [Natronorubrum thiooxidans]
MVSDTADTPPPIDTYGTDSSTGRTTIFNALIGAAVGIVLSFVPGSTLLGGAVAGYLEGDADPVDGLRVGAIAGLCMLAPFVLFGMIAWLFFLGAGGPGTTIGVVFIVGLTFGALYTVGLSALGAVFGRYIKTEL